MRSGFENEYKIKDTLGSGAFGVVKKCKRIKCGSNYAVKIITKSNLTEEDEETIRNEVDILESLNHRYIIELISAYDDPDDYFLVVELICGGELFTRMASRPTFTEKEAIDVTKTLLTAVAYLHGKNIAHRDLKPENILLRDEEKESDLNLVDFGMAARVTGPCSLKTRCGTPLFIAPEIVIGNPYGTKADMWSLGVIIYTLLCGYEPFGGPKSILLHRIVSGKFRFHSEHWSGISFEAKNFIKSLIEVNPDARSSANEALQHEWICSNDEKILNRSVSCDMLKTYQACKRDRAKAKAKKIFNVVKTNLRLTKLKNKIIPTMKMIEENFISSIDENDISTKISNLTLSKNFHSSFSLGKNLGVQGFETIEEAVSEKNGSKYAVRITSKEVILPIDENELFNEIQILQSLKHDNIVTIYHAYDDANSYFLVTDLLQENILDWITKEYTKKKCYDEKVVRDICKPLLDAVAYCHSNNIAIRDLKLENILVSISSEQQHGCDKVKLANFGFAKVENEPDCLITQCGSPLYVAPEIISGLHYGKKVDMWSFGVIVYVLLSGRFPFFNNNSTEHELYKMILRGDFDFPKEYNWDDNIISCAAKDFIKNLLVVNPEDRMSAKDALKHEWIVCGEECFSKVELQSSVMRLEKCKAAGEVDPTLPCLKCKLNSLGPVGCLESLQLPSHHSPKDWMKSLTLSGWL